jgi:hypothetical protein
MKRRIKHVTVTGRVKSLTRARTCRYHVISTLFHFRLHMHARVLAARARPALHSSAYLAAGGGLLFGAQISAWHG